MDDYLSKSPSAGRMGKAAEFLIAATCILTTRGELNVSTSLVDDEGVDLVFHRRGASRTLAVQVKARMSDGKQVRDKDRCIAVVRSQTFRPRPDLDLLFAVIDIERGALVTSWLIPSRDFAAIGPTRDSRNRFKFNASMKPDTQDRWIRFRLHPHQLAPQILTRLHDLEIHDTNQHPIG